MSYNTIISAEQLANHLDNPDWIVFDCRFSLADSEAGGKAYRLGHIANARYVHLDKDLSSAISDYSGRHPLPDFSLLAKKLGHWGVKHSSQVVVYDDAGGAFAGRMWWLLRCMGHDRVALLDGGLPQWRREGHSLTTALPKIRKTHFRAYLDSKQWLSARQVEDGLATRSITLIDARPPERFRGEQEPIDPIAGHVPKALNRPFQQNLNKQGCFLPADRLKQQFLELLAKRDDRQVVHMCGSGVTACHNLLAMEIAGLPGSKLYAGSWSEWIRNKNRGIAKG
ncbi:sulfurtransferase [Methylomarinum vadi]|uniref:sulfurtransferase n=1 Tax=Methylomarinum vadi TaxID=438855 RepID=UPI0004DF915A|nr:sulfurtransferase [Methylomarinum vadi]